MKLKLLWELGFNLLLPWVAYTLVEPSHGELAALIASALPPMIWSAGELIFQQRLDALSMLVLGGIALSILAMMLGGDARLLLVRESLISGLIGLSFLGSLIIGRPLVFYLARATMQRQNGQEGRERFLRWSESVVARKGLRVMTLIWGLGLVLEASLRIWAALIWTPARFLAVMPPAGYAFAAMLTLWTLWYVRRLRQGGDSVLPEPSGKAPKAQ